MTKSNGLTDIRQRHDTRQLVKRLVLRQNHQCEVYVQLIVKNCIFRDLGEKHN